MPRVAQWLLCGGCPVPGRYKNTTKRKSNRTQQCHESLNGSYVVIWRLSSTPRERQSDTEMPRVAQWVLCGGCPVPRWYKNPTTGISNWTKQCHESLNGSYVAVVQNPEGIKTQRRGKVIGHSNATSPSITVMWQFGGCPLPQGCKYPTTGKSNRTQQCHKSLNGSYVAVVLYPEGVKNQRREKAIGHSNATSCSMALMWRFVGCPVPRGCKDSTTE